MKRERESPVHMCCPRWVHETDRNTPPLWLTQTALKPKRPWSATAANVAFSGAVPAFVLENQWLGLEEALTVL